MSDIVSIPSQIVVTSRLEGAEHAALKILSEDAKESDIRDFLLSSSKFTTPGDINNANAVLQVSASANETLYSRIRRDEIMCQALMEIMKDEIEEREDMTKINAIKSLMKTLHLSVDQAMDALEISPEKRTIFLTKLQ